MSREALEALAISVVRRVHGVAEIQLGITATERDIAGRNWDVLISPEPFRSEDISQRVREAIAPWRDRFDLVS
jgi:hypothetical protein